MLFINPLQSKKKLIWIKKHDLNPVSYLGSVYRAVKGNVYKFRVGNVYKACEACKDCGGSAHIDCVGSVYKACDSSACSAGSTLAQDLLFNIC